MGNRSVEKDQVWYSEQVVQMLVADIRASLERQLTSGKVSQAFQETSDRLADRLDGADRIEERPKPPETSLPGSARDQISALIIDMRMW